MQIDVSFENWKRLTARLNDEKDSYDQLIGCLLAREDDSASANTETGGALFKRVFLPNGTRLRGSYKGKTYFGEIKESTWIDPQTGEHRNSPSEAAHAVTKTPINGWMFWSARRPLDSEWRSLDALRGELVP